MMKRLLVEHKEPFSKWLLPLSILIAYMLHAWGVLPSSDWALASTLCNCPFALKRFVTYAWVHTSPLHLCSSLGLLLILQLFFLRRISASWWWGVFLAGVAASGLLFVFVIPETTAPLAGASAGVAALIYFALCIHMPKHGVLVAGLAGPILIIDHLTLASGEIYSFYCHLAGYLVGALVAIVWHRNQKKKAILADTLSTIEQKAQSSGYHSLNEEEKQTLHRNNR